VAVDFGPKRWNPKYNAQQAVAVQINPRSLTIELTDFFLIYECLKFRCVGTGFNRQHIDQPSRVVVENNIGWLLDTEKRKRITPEIQSLKARQVSQWCRNGSDSSWTNAVAAAQMKSWG
jgi:hypothetical protein